MMNKNRSFWLGMDRKFFLVEEDMPVLGDHDVLIKPMANSICGSELRTYTTNLESIANTVQTVQADDITSAMIFISQQVMIITISAKLKEVTAKAP